MNRFQRNDVWFTLKDNLIEEIRNDEYGIEEIYTKDFNDRETEWIEYAFVVWRYGGAHLRFVLRNGTLIDGDDYVRDLE